MRALRQSSFIVYAKPPFGGPARVLALSRPLYASHGDRQFEACRRRRQRSGVRLQGLSPQRPQPHMHLDPHEFIRRFLLHVLPDGLHGVRHYGFLAKGERGEKLAYVRDRSKSNGRGSPTTKPRRRRSPSQTLSRTVRRLPGLRRPHALRGAHRAAQIRRLSLRHIMTTNAGPISIAFEFPRRRANCAAGAKVQRVVCSPSARFGLDPSSSPPPEPPKRSHPKVQNILRSPAAAFERMTWRSKSNRRCAFPIAPNRPAPSFNPAYVRSPFAMPNPCTGDLA